MEMHQIRYFLAVSETLNVTRAAELCHVSQPALTRAIQKLEDELGGLLFRRERTTTHLTDLGRLMKPHLETIFDEAHAARKTATKFLKLERAPLNVGIMCTIGPLRFTGMLTRFRRDNPGVEVALVEGVPRRLAELLYEGRLDVAIMAQPEPFGDRFAPLQLYRERFGVAFAPGHRFNAANALALAQIHGEHYLDRINCEYASFIDKLCEERGIEVTVVYRSEREDWIQTMVLAGLGVCCTPEFSLLHAGVQFRPLIDPEIAREVSLVTVAGRRQSPAVAKFVASVRRYDWTS